MVAFYKHDIAAWRGGTASLTHEQYRVYHVLVEQMMLEEGSILVHERMLSGLANMSTRAFRAVVDELVRGGKVFRDGDRLTNGRVETELSAVRQNRQNASLGGRSRSVRDQFTTSSAEKKSRTSREHSANTPRTGHEEQGNPNEINGADEAPLLRHMNIREKRREEVEKEKTLSCPKEKKSASRATPFPEGFEPNETDRRIAAENGITEAAVLAKVVDHFRDHHAMKGNVFKDWHAALRTWLRSPLLHQRPLSTAGPPNGYGRPVPNYEAEIAAGLAEIERRRAQRGQCH